MCLTQDDRERYEKVFGSGINDCWDILADRIYEIKWVNGYGDDNGTTERISGSKLRPWNMFNSIEFCHLANLGMNETYRYCDPAQTLELTWVA